MATKKLSELSQYQGTLTEAKIPATISSTNYNLTLAQLKAFFLGAASIVTEMIDNGAVTGDKIATGAVTYSKLGANAVQAAKIKDGAVITAKIADGAVSSSKLSQAIMDLINSKASESDLTALSAIVSGLGNSVQNLLAYPIDSIEFTNENGSLKIGLESIDGNFRFGEIQGVFKTYGSGLSEASNSISIKLNTASGLVVDSAGIAVSPKTDSGVIVDDTGVSINTASDSDIDEIINLLN